MSIEVGQQLPAGHFGRMGDNGPERIETRDYFQRRRVVLFSVPGAFTPTCTNSHLPGFLRRLEQFRQAGVDAVACTAVNDVYVMHAWKQSMGAAGIDMLADGNGDFVRSLGLENDTRKFDMGWRGKRFALVAEDAVVTHLFIEASGEFRVSAAGHVLTHL